MFVKSERGSPKAVGIMEKPLVPSLPVNLELILGNLGMCLCLQLHVVNSRTAASRGRDKLRAALPGRTPAFRHLRGLFESPTWQVGLQDLEGSGVA